MKALSFKKQLQNTIDAALIETKVTEEISQLMIASYKHILSAGNLDQFNILNKKLTDAINAQEGWKYPSLNGIYRQGYKVSTPPNILSTFRQFCQLELDQEDRDQAIKDGITQMRALIKIQKETASAANDDVAAALGAEKSAAATAEVMAELKEIEEEQISPAHQQAIDLLMKLDASQVSAVTRYLGSLLEKAAA